MEQRDAHFTAVVETNVLQLRCHGLLIAAGIFVRESPTDMPFRAWECRAALERDHPADVHCRLPHVCFGAETSALEPYLADWPSSLFRYARSWW